jgi:hypothetical protein
MNRRREKVSGRDGLHAGGRLVVPGRKPDEKGGLFALRRLTVH